MTPQISGLGPGEIALILGVPVILLGGFVLFVFLVVKLVLRLSRHRP